jgi:hypothetical protein
MSFGFFTPAQCKTVRALVQGQRVLDLGAGDLGIAVKLVELGASSVVAVDTFDMEKAYNRAYNLRGQNPLPSNVRPSVAKIEKLAGGPKFLAKIAMLSWPSPNPIEGLVEVVSEMPYVVYLGKNVRGINQYGDESTTWCGTGPLFHHLKNREVFAYVPDPLNTLIVYGPTRVARPLHGEELAALTNRDRRVTWGFEEVEREARRLAEGD